MEQGHYLSFGEFRLDPVQQRLWRGEQEIALRSRPLAVLRYLVTHSGRVISKEELLKQVWAGTYVTKTALQVCVRAIREALSEEVDAPRYLETVGREGYRWIGEVQSPKFKSQSPESAISTLQSAIVGREAELECLHGWWQAALKGTRQVAFISGQPGIGKTAVVDLFVEHLRAEGRGRIGRGQCVEQYGESEAYLPVLEALSQMCRAPGGQRVIEVLSRYAPTWLVQMPALLEGSALLALQQRVAEATRERMLREMADALEVLTGGEATYAVPMLLVFEDLHASDRSTIDLISYLAQRRELARLLIIGTYRPATVVVKEHPLGGIVRELRVHGQCQELRLELLTEADVTEYLDVRLGIGSSPIAQATPSTLRLRSPVPACPPPEGAPQVQAGQAALRTGIHNPQLSVVAQQLHRHTEGNPLFLVNMVAYLLGQRVLRMVEGQWQITRSLAGVGLPESLQQMIVQQIERLRPEQQQVLAAASVEGYEFDAAVVAKVLAKEVVEVEERLAELEHVYGFVQFVAEDEFPNRTLRLRYRFGHVLYQNAFYASLRPTRKAQWSGVVAQALIDYYGEKSGTVAVELAHLYQTAREFARAAEYYLVAARHAAQVFAYTEAEVLAERGVEMLSTLPDAPERVRQELDLQLTLGAVQIATKGYAAPEVQTAYARAHTLYQQVGATPHLFSILGGLWQFYLMRAEYQTARELGEQLLTLAQNVQDPALVLGAHNALGQTFYWMGEFPRARDHIERTLALYDSQQHRSLALLLGGEDPGVACQGHLAFVLWFLGYPEQALQSHHEAYTLAQELRSPFHVAWTFTSAAWLHAFRRDRQAVQEQAEATIALSSEQGFAFFLALGTILRGWALVEQGQQEEGIAQMHQGLADCRATGAETGLPYFLALLAEVYGKVGQAEAGQRVLTEALAVANKAGGRFFYEAELHRLKGELTLQKFQVVNSEFKVPNGSDSGVRSPESEAEECFQKAIEIARQQRAKSLELRAAVSLSRLWQKQGKTRQARKLLAKIYGWFTEGFDTPNLTEAKALLEELSQ